jgi:hypothetical protein
VAVLRCSDGVYIHKIVQIKINIVSTFKREREGKEEKMGLRDEERAKGEREWEEGASKKGIEKGGKSKGEREGKERLIQGVEEKRGSKVQGGSIKGRTIYIRRTVQAMKDKKGSRAEVVEGDREIRRQPRVGRHTKKRQRKGVERVGR